MDNPWGPRSPSCAQTRSEADCAEKFAQQLEQRSGATHPFLRASQLTLDYQVLGGGYRGLSGATASPPKLLHRHLYRSPTLKLFRTLGAPETYVVRHVHKFQACATDPNISVLVPAKSPPPIDPARG